MYKNNFKAIFTFLSIFIFFMIFDTSKVFATYKGCNVEILGTDYYDCGDTLYTYPEDKTHSTYLKSSSGNFIYAGEDQGYSVFYVNGFDYYNYTYDDRSSANNNIWTILKSQGKILFDGSFSDSWLLDETHQGQYRKSLRKTTFVIEQYHQDGEFVRKILINNVSKSAYDQVELDYYKVEKVDLIYDGIILSDDKVEEVIGLEDRVLLNIKSRYGIKNVEALLNNHYFNRLNTIGIVEISDFIKNNLNKGVLNKLTINVTNYFGNTLTCNYDLFLLGNDVHIEFETISSNAISTSRRIVVNANAGKGKTLDTDYCWYYWSKDPNHELSEEEFLANYAKSEYKGSYSKDKGVILRNASGTYYLYALAKDDDSSKVVRSEGYTLDNQFVSKYDVGDIALILVLINLCVLPIIVYVSIKKKGY